MIKKLLISMLAGMMALGTFAQENKFTVKGTFEGFKDSVKISLLDVSCWKTIVVDSRAVTGEVLEFSCDLKDAALLNICEGNDPWAKLLLPAIPGETLIIYHDDNQVTHFGGSQFYVDYDEAQQIINPIWIALTESQKRMSGNGEPIKKEEEEHFFNQYKKLHNALDDDVLNYVKAHPDQDAAAALIFVLFDDNKAVEAAEAMLTERARNSVAAQLYKACSRPIHIEK